MVYLRQKKAIKTNDTAELKIIIYPSCSSIKKFYYELCYQNLNLA